MAKPINKSKIYFNIEKDILLLKECLNLNPFQLGNDQWKQVVKNLKDNYSMDISVRTAKERINNLLQKLQKEDLITKSGTEEQHSERVQLLYEIMQLKDENVIEIISEDHQTQQNSNEEYFCIGEREEIIEEKYGNDSPSIPTKRKRPKNFEEEIIFKKHLKEMELEEKKLDLKHKEKMKELEIEEKRLEIEKNNKEMYNAMFNLINKFYEKLENN